MKLLEKLLGKKEPEKPAEKPVYDAEWARNMAFSYVPLPTRTRALEIRVAELESILTRELDCIAALADMFEKSGAIKSGSSDENTE